MSSNCFTLNYFDQNCLPSWSTNNWGCLFFCNMVKGKFIRKTIQWLITFLFSPFFIHHFPVNWVDWKIEKWAEKKNKMDKDLETYPQTLKHLFLVMEKRMFLFSAMAATRTSWITMFANITMANYWSSVLILFYLLTYYPWPKKWPAILWFCLQMS